MSKTWEEEMALHEPEFLEVIKDPRVAPLVEASRELNQVKLYDDDESVASGSYVQVWGLHTIAEQYQALDLNLAFITKHAKTLAGLSWRVGYLDPEIEIRLSLLTKECRTAAEVAKRWPGATWRRKKPDYPDKESLAMNWEAVIDGVTIRIEKAETFEPFPAHLMKEGVVTP